MASDKSPAEAHTYHAKNRTCTHVRYKLTLFHVSLLVGKNDDLTKKSSQ